MSAMSTGERKESLHITACQPCPDYQSLGHESSLIFAGRGQEIWILVPALPLTFHVTVALVASPVPVPSGLLGRPMEYHSSVKREVLHAGALLSQHLLCFQMCPAIDAVLVYVNKKWANLNGEWS